MNEPEKNSKREAKRGRHRTDPSDPVDRSDQKIPACPLCGKPMALRTARKGRNAGSQFWGCCGYPKCKGVRPLDGSVGSDRSDG